MRKPEPSNRGAILSYHRIAPADLDPWGLRVTVDNFRSQLECIRRIGNPISLEELVHGLKYGDIPDRALVLTFDDGYLDNLTNALPLLEEYKIPATIFVTSGFVGKPGFWWEDLENIFLRPCKLPEKLKIQYGALSFEWDLGSAADYTSEQYAEDLAGYIWKGHEGTRIRLYHDVYKAVYQLPFDAKEWAINHLLKWADYDPTERSKHRPLTWSELSELSASKSITIGAHTRNHLPLNKLSATQQLSEIRSCGNELSESLAFTVETFAYPHGLFSPETERIVSDCGFICACTTEEDSVSTKSDPMRLPRFQIRNLDAESFSGQLYQWLGNHA